MSVIPRATALVLIVAAAFGGSPDSPAQHAGRSSAKPAELDERLPLGRSARPDPDSVPVAWLTQAERTEYAETATYDQTVAYCRRLADASPRAQYTTFGTSAQGYDLPLLILSADGSFAPDEARDAGKLVVLLQNCIHPGECAGKDASLALARDILITKTHADLLEHVTLLIIPIFNVDGYLRFGPYNRINQNGPKAMGWRVSATNINFNRDYTKADAPGMQAWLRLWNQWQPDLLFDNHTTDGSDHRYLLLYASATHEDTDAAIAAWTRDLYATVLPQIAADGHETIPYFGEADRADPAKGIYGPGVFPPRFSTGYAAVCNRPSILVEVHMLKPYALRVRSNYDLMLHTLEELNRDPQALRAAVRAADARTVSRFDDAAASVPLRFERTDESRPFVFKGLKISRRQSEITGGEVLEFGDEPVDYSTTFHDGFRVSLAVQPPAAYVIPAEWTEIVARLQLHGVEMFRLREPRSLRVEKYRFTGVQFPQRSFEGRQLPRFGVEKLEATGDFPAGTWVVPLDQRRATLAVHLLEPQAPDSFAAWGFFNGMLEQKEYAEDFLMEPIARAMLAQDPALKAEFERKLAEDEAFARDADARLNFFYRRSPYWDQRLELYPISRLMDRSALAAVRP